MSLNASTARSTSGYSTVPLALFAVALLVVGGVAIAGTAAYFELHPRTTASSAPPAATKSPPNTNNSSSTSPPKTTPTSVTITDDLGRTETVPYDPARVAVFGPSIVDAMYRLGLRAHVVAVDCYAPAFGGLSEDYSPDQVALWNLSSSMCVEIAPDFDYEALLNASPTLVLASTIVSASAVEEIQDVYGIPVVMLQPPTLSGIEVDLTLLGEIFGVAANASALNAELQDVLAEAQNVTTNLTDSGAPLPTAFLTYYPDAAGSEYPGYYSYGPGTFGESLIEFASAVSITANSTLPYPLVTGDQLLVAQPQFIIYGTGYGLNTSSYAAGPDWSSFDAVTNGTAYGMDSNWLTEPDPTMILVGLPNLLHLLHPTLVPPPS